MADYWQKQGSEPLYPDLLWSRPENRQHAGKLLIIGGNLHGFSAPAQAYQTAAKQGIGVGKVLLPDALKKTVGRILENGEYAPSTPSGSFSKPALAEWLDFAGWADGVLLAGDLGRNSETAIVAEKFLQSYKQLTILTRDAADCFYGNPRPLWQRAETTIVVSLSQLQKLTKASAEKPVQFSMGLPQLAEWLHDYTHQVPSVIVTYHQANILVAHRGLVTSAHIGEQESWRLQTAAAVSVWQLQNPSKPLEAATTAVYEQFQAKSS